MMKTILTTTFLLLLMCSKLVAQELLMSSESNIDTTCNVIKIAHNPNITANSSNLVNLFSNVQYSSSSGSEILSHIPNQHEISTSYAVGEIPINVSFSPTGSLSCTIPIDVVTRLNSLQPNIALLYNSNGGNSVVGQGWSISGLSAIVRTNSTVYHDGNAGPILLDNDSRYPNNGQRRPGNTSPIPTNIQPVGTFSLDGIRLLEMEQDGSNVIYEAEQGNIRITAYVASGVIKYFKVFYPNGTTGIFGYENNTSNQLCYPLTRFEDTNGSYVSYNYVFRKEHYYIDRIDYGASAANASHFASVKFNYSTRSDISMAYVAGKKIVEDYLLNSIVCSSGTTAIRTYTLTYQTADVSLLKQVSYTEGGASLNPLKFYYGTDGQVQDIRHVQLNLASWVPDSNMKLAICRGKFDVGTNDDALIIYPQKNPYSWNESKEKFINEYHPDQEIIVYQRLGDGYDYGSGFTRLTAEEGFVQILIGDIDGIEGDEVIKINNQMVNGYDRLTIKTYKPYAVSGLILYKSTTINLPYGRLEGYWDKLIPKSFVLGDFNGDGKQELLVVRAGLSNSFDGIIYASKPSFFSAYFIVDLDIGSIVCEKSAHDIPEYNKDGYQLFPIDYDSDGKTDMAIVTSDGLIIQTFECSETSYSSVKTLVPSSSIFNLRTFSYYHRDLLVGDINGDGKTDFLISPPPSGWGSREEWVPRGCCDEQDLSSPSSGLYICKSCGDVILSHEGGYESIPYYNDNGNVWTVHYSNGKDGFDTQSMPIDRFESLNKYVLQDVNQDGLLDFVRTDEGKIRVFLNRNGAFQTDPSLTTDFISHHLKLIPSDVPINSMCNADLLCLNIDKIHKVSFNRDDGIQRMLSGAVNSFGIVTKTEYRRLNKNGDYLEHYYDDGSSGHYSFPYARFSGPLAVASKVESYGNNILLSSVEYGYRNAVVHKQGLGFLGFEQVQIKNNLKGQTATAKYDPLRYSVLIEESIPNILKVSYDYDVLKNQTLKINLRTKIAQDYLKNITVSTAYTYDSYGNLTKEETSYGEGLSTIVSTTYQNIRSNSQNIIGLPVAITTQKKRNNDIWVTRKDIEYNDKLLPRLQKEYAQSSLIGFTGGNQVREVQWTYDSFGNLKNEKIRHYSSSDWLETKYEYSSNGRFLTKKTDPMGLSNTYAYDQTKVLLTSTANHKNKQTTLEYDVLGRVVKANYPDGSQGTTTYEWTVGQTINGGGKAVYRITEKATNTSDIYTYYDAQNREILVEHKGLNGANIFVENKYDNLGRLVSVSDPYIGVSTALWNTTEYDSYDRPIRVTHPTGNIETYAYDGNKITVSSGGMAKTITYNAWGEAVKVQDPGGAIQYTYRPDGQINRTTAPDGSRTEFQYDSYGRQTGLTDPSAGTLTYTYDANGYQNSHKNARGQIITTTFNKFGLPTQRFTPEVNTSYTYNNDYQLSKISDSESNGGGISSNFDPVILIAEKTYVYDDFGRMIKETDKVGSEQLEIVYSYTVNQLTSVGYSKMPNKPLQYTYDSYGNLTTIKLNGDVVWRLVQENSRRQALKILLGNGVEQTYGYTSTGTPTWRRAGVLMASPFQSFSYGFDEAKGLLDFRSDVVNSTHETFAYDNLKRLTQHNDYKQHQITYNSMGSPTRKTDVGQMVYNVTNKPYAIGQVQQNTGSIPIREQYVTYSSFDRPISISENGYQASFTYSVDGARKLMEVTHNNTQLLSRYYLSDCYEKDIVAGGTQTERLYLGGSGYNAPAVWIKENGQEKLLYIHRDYLGSITHLSDATGIKAAEYSYDAWGRLRDPATLKPYGFDEQPTLILWTWLYRTRTPAVVWADKYECPSL
ncbi:MAG: hypothetical protein LBG19_12895 [Prevotellaceae bacterium]|jgi:YD repeat-containing protein|nr:hypothetical protein [Prevotellaceae bacterium]